MKKVFLAIIIFILGISSVYATSGFLRKDSVKTCNGILYGQHSSDNHWHKAVLNDDGGYNAVGDPIYSDPCGGSVENETPVVEEETPIITKPVISKSSDNTLLKLVVNGEEITILDNMLYTTSDTYATIVATSKDSKATIEYDKNINLIIGENEANIIVKSESGISKTYLLTIKRESQLSSNAKVVIKVDDEIIQFDDFVNKEVINVNNSVSKIDLTYDIEDEKTTIEILNNDNLKEGNNEIILIATAEDGTKQEYKINVYKYSKAEDIIYGVVGFGVLGGIGYGVFRIIKKRKSKI